MADKFIFADEAGCFAFNKMPNVSKYFILCSITMDSCDVGNALLQLRRELAKAGAPLGPYFHATDDKQVIRDHLYKTALKYDFNIQATIMEKSKAQPQIRVNRPIFYQNAWYYHFKYGVAQEITEEDSILVTSASIGTRKEQKSFANSVHNVMRQTANAKEWNTDFCPAASDPCVQVADYCAWAIQRKWERGDDRSYQLIKDRITYEYDLWSHGTTHYY